MIIGIILVVLVLLVFFFISTQRSLVSLEENVNNAFANIAVNLNSRWDALKALANAVKAYSEHEYETLTGIIEKRSAVKNANDVKEGEALLGSALSRINAVAESYPELKASELYTKTMDSINEYENKVRISRMVYNDSVTKLNRAVKMFPTSIAASILNVHPKEYLSTDEGKKICRIWSLDNEKVFGEHIRRHNPSIFNKLLCIIR